MVFKIALYGSLAVFILGSLHRVGTWFRIQIGPQASRVSPGQRLLMAIRGTAATIFSRRIFSRLNVFFFDILLQRGIFKQSVLRGLAHISIFYGFFLLLLMHALEKPLSRVLLPDYMSTLNPYLFLRNLFGFMVLVGIVLAVGRRIRSRRSGLFTNASDRWALLILATIMLSGFLLEGMKIISAPIFNEMVDEYAPMAEPEEVEQLKELWARHYAVVFPDRNGSGQPGSLVEGRELNEDSCIDCHARPRAAFVSFSAAKLITPLASFLARTRTDIWLWTIHFLACFVGLAYLPFSKFFHIFSTPVSLLANDAQKQPLSHPANRATRRALALDACMHCGTCSQHCSVGPVYHHLTNANILPAEKLISTQAMAKGELFAFQSMQALSEGSMICTRCYRCTTVCPAGIDLQDLWIASREELAERGFPEPHIWVREANTAEWAQRVRNPEATRSLPDKKPERLRNLSDRIETFYACVQCQTCTNVCPVVACSENPDKDLGMTPQQIMNLLRLGLKDFALGSPMVWDCVTCYMCQEHCPEGIRVADILYELRNLAYTRFSTVRTQGKTPRGVGRAEPPGEPKEYPS